MDWQLIAVAGFAVFFVSLLVALLLYSNFHGLRSAIKPVLRLKSRHAEARSVTGADCRG